MTPKDKYKNVWIYRQLTDLLIQLMDEGDMSPTDVIESARLACERHYLRNRCYKQHQAFYHIYQQMSNW